MKSYTPRKLYGLYGKPVAHSLSPLMHNTWFDLLGIDGIYMPFQVHNQDLEQAVDAIRVLGIQGVNVTVPHKKRIAPLLDRLEGDAAITGSVNTVLNHDGELIGYSTDGIGLLRSLKEEAGWEPKGRSAMILGAGGASSAIAFRLAIEGISRLVLVGRDPQKAESVACGIKEKTGFSPEITFYDTPKFHEVICDMSLIVNSTPLGMVPEVESMPPLSPAWSHPDALLCDLVYHPLETKWLREAAVLGRKTLSGLGMLVYQGAESFRLWNNISPPVENVISLLKNRL